MKIREVLELVKGKLIFGCDFLDMEVEAAFASDLMSDVLTVEVDRMLLLTGLANLQTIRTAEMSDIPCIVFSRNKKVSEAMVELAKENEIVLIKTPYSVFRVSGILYEKGMKPIY